MQPEVSLLIPPAVCSRLCIVGGDFPICAETTGCVTTLKWIKGLIQLKKHKKHNSLTCISPAVLVVWQQQRHNAGMKGREENALH